MKDTIKWYLENTAWIEGLVVGNIETGWRKIMKVDKKRSIKRINVTKPFLPSRKKLDSYIDQIYESALLSNNGPLVQELTKRLEEYLEVENLLLVANGTLALQIAYKALNINGSAVTTPFTYIATSSSLLWEGIEPLYADIDSDTFCLDPRNIQSILKMDTTAIVPVHVFGNACDVGKIEKIASKNSLKIIYDASHAFGIRYNGKSLLCYGDASTLSFHATKIFHTIEGGAIIFKRKDDLIKARQMINFGIGDSKSIFQVGINAKMNEFQAAMGLSLLDEIDVVIENRAILWEKYKKNLSGYAKLQKWNSENNNYGYFPVVFENELVLNRVNEVLNRSNIFPRRYFYPSINTVKSINHFEQDAKNSEDLSKRILSLPLYAGITNEEQDYIINDLGIIMKVLYPNSF